MNEPRSGTAPSGGRPGRAAAEPASDASAARRLAERTVTLLLQDLLTLEQTIGLPRPSIEMAALRGDLAYAIATGGVDRIRAGLYGDAGEGIVEQVAFVYRIASGRPTGSGVEFDQRVFLPRPAGGMPGSIRLVCRWSSVVEHLPVEALESFFRGELACAWNRLPGPIRHGPGSERGLGTAGAGGIVVARALWIADDFARAR